MTTTKTTAASLIDQILDKHNEVEQAEQKAVAPAVACGKLLRLAKESVKAERKKWKDWLEANIEFSQETVSIYMRLAENEKLIAKASSIREALKAIREKDGNAPRGRKEQEEQQSDDPEIDPNDEPEGDDPETVVANLGPDEVFQFINRHWTTEDIRTLFELLDKHRKTAPETSSALLKSQSVLPPAPSPSVGVRRV
jgi:hypothetical protein